MSRRTESATERVIAIEPGPPARAALLIDGRLDDLLIDPPADDPTPRLEEIHRVRVRRLIPKQGAAIVKLGGGESGFLRDAKGLSEGDLLPAQVSGLAEPGKATPMTARRLHRGRYAILTPHAPGVNVARSLKDAELRDRLAGLGAEALRGAGFSDEGPGLILRSAASEAGEDEVLADISDLVRIETSVRAALEDGGPPELLVDAPGAEIVAWREWGDPDEVIREDGVFDRLGLWETIADLRKPRVALRAGAWMAVEPTSALVAIDVNTGADLSVNAAAEANRAACVEVARQLRLRGLGGQVSIDFAPMRKNDRKAVESGLKRAFAGDPVQTTLAGWTPLGHFELLRKRERRPLTEVLTDG